MLYPALAGIFFGLTVVAVKLSAGKVYPLLGTILLPAFAAVIQIAVLTHAKYRGANIFATSKGILVLAIGGVCLALYSIFLFLSLNEMNLDKVTPIVYVLAITLATVIGVLFLKEPFDRWNFLGIILSLGGLYFLFFK